MKLSILGFLAVLPLMPFPNTYAGEGFSSKYQVKAKGLVADYQLWRDSGTTIVDRSGNGNNLTMTSGAGCTFAAMGLSCTSGNTSNIVISNALFAQMQTVVYIGTVTGSGYRALIGSGALNFMLDQDQNDIRIYNSGADTFSNRVVSIVDTTSLNLGSSNFPQGLGYAQCLTWVRSSTADKLFVGDREVAGYQSQGGTASYNPGGSALTLFSSALSGGWGSANTGYRVLAFNYALTANEIAAYIAPLRTATNARAVATGTEARNQIGFWGNSITAGTTNPGGPGTIQSSGWDLASLLAAGNSVSTANALSAAQRPLLAAIQGSTTPGDNGAVNQIGSANPSGGPAVVSLAQVYDFAALRHVAIGWEYTNYAGSGSATSSQEIAARNSLVKNLVSVGWQVIMSTTLKTSGLTSNSSYLGYLVAVNADCLANYATVGALSCWNLAGTAGLDYTITPGNFWDGTHPNLTGQPILAAQTRQALATAYIY